MKTFYFNTGVQTNTVRDFPYDYHSKVGNVISNNGVLTIPYECDVPDDTPHDAKIIMIAESSKLINLATSIHQNKPDNMIIAKTNKDDRDLFAYILIKKDL